MEKKIFGLIIISLLFMISISGCINSNTNDEEYYEVLYEIKIELINSSDYFIFLPLPITAPNVVNETSKIINDLSFQKGNGKFVIEDSKYGFVLNVSSSESITLKAEKTWERYSNFDKYFNYTFVELSTSKYNDSVEGFQDIYFYFYGLENHISLVSFHCYTLRRDDNNVLDKDEWKMDLYEVNDGWNKFPINVS
jgi:hypothetical protein